MFVCFVDNLYYSRERPKTMSGDIVYDKFHFRHDSKWSGRLGPAEGGGLLLCVACVIEMIESDDIAVRNMMNVFCRKSRLNPTSLIHFLWFIGVCYPFALWLWATSERLWRVRVSRWFPSVLMLTIFVCAAILMQVVRKSFALSGISGVLKCSPGAMRELLRQDHRVGLRLTASLLGEKRRWSPNETSWSDKNPVVSYLCSQSDP